MVNKYRTNSCGELRISDVGKEVRLAGFVQKIRNLGKGLEKSLRKEINQAKISEEKEQERFNTFE